MMHNGIDLLQYVLDVSSALEAKFTEAEVREDPLLLAAASIWLRTDGPSQVTHSGIREFLDSVAYWSGRKGGMSASQAKGVLNVLVAQHKAPSLESTGTDFDGTQTIKNGYYRLDNTVIKVSDDFRKTAPTGSQVVAILDGDDANTRNYTGIAFLQGSKLFVWKRYAHATAWIDAVNGLLALAADDPIVREARDRYSDWSERCSVCHKLLTKNHAACEASLEN